MAAISLLEAAKSGNIIHLRQLLTFGHWQDINAYSPLPGLSGEWTPLMVASMNGHVDCVHELLSHGADVTYFNSDGDYSLNLAAQTGHAQCVEVLIGHQAGVDQQNTFSGRTALMDAIENKNLAFVETLLRHHANPNIQTFKTRSTALMIACACDFPEAIPVLLSHGADEYLVNSEGKTALTIAEKGGAFKCTAALLRLEDPTCSSIKDNTKSVCEQKIVNDTKKEHNENQAIVAGEGSAQEGNIVDSDQQKCKNDGQSNDKEAQIKTMQFLHAVSKIMSND